MPICKRLEWPKLKETKVCGGPIKDDAKKKYVDMIYKYAWALAKRAKIEYKTVLGQKYAKKWFGKKCQPKQLEENLNIVYGFFKVSTFKLRCYKSPDKNDLAACPGGQLGTVKKSTSVSFGPPKYDWPYQRNMMFGDRFFGDTGDDLRFTMGEKVGSLLHELTHLFIGTKDMEFPKGNKNSGEVYGAKLAKDYADALNSSPLKSAENWCYYFTEFRQQLKKADIVEAFGSKMPSVGWPMKDGDGEPWDMLTPSRVAWRTKTYPKD